MRSKIRKTLIAQFSERLRSCLPQFQRCGEERASGGHAVWAWEVAPALTFFVALNIADSQDNFAIEAGWSDDGKFPWHDVSFRFKDLSLPKTYGRLSFLWVTGKVEYRWEIVRGHTPGELQSTIEAQVRQDWEEMRRIDNLIVLSLDDALKRIAPLVDDAVQKIVEYGMPLFRRVLEHRGIGGVWDK